MKNTKLYLKFGKKYYRFHLSVSTSSLANNEIKKLRNNGFNAQYVKRKDYFYPHNTVYKVYKLKKKIQSWKILNTKLKTNVLFYRSDAFGKGFVTIDKVEQGSYAWNKYKAKYIISVNTPLTLETKYSNNIKEAKKISKEFILKDNKKLRIFNEEKI